MITMFRRLKIFVFVLLFLCSIGIGFAQENSTDTFDNISEEMRCATQKIQLVGAKKYLVGEPLNLVPSEILSGTIVVHTISKDGRDIQKITEEKISIPLNTVGEYHISTVLTLGDCKQVIDTDIQVYQEAINILGKIDNKVLHPYESIFLQKNILINTFSVDTTDDIYSRLVLEQGKISASDTIIITSNAIDQVFSALIQLTEISHLDLKTKKIIIVNPMNKNLMKRIVAKYSKFLDSNSLYTTDMQNVINLLASLSNKEDITQSEYLTIFSLSDQKTPGYLFLSKTVDTLIYNGFPVDLVALLLTISLAVLVVTIFRQVIGFDIFGSYTPLMVGVAIYMLGLWLSLVLFFFAFLATIIVRIFTKKVYLLYSAKVSLLISLYFILIFVGLSYAQNFLADVVNFSLFSNAFVVFPMLLIILISEKIFNENMKFTSKGWRVSLLEFMFVSTVVFFIIHSVYIQNFMLSYPEIIVLIILFIVLVGRFSGLQLLEYFRFYPLLKGDNQDEEEE